MLGKRRIISSDRYCERNPTGASRPVAADIGRPIAADAFDYTYDSIGNRLSSSVAGVSQTYTANALNQYLTAGAKTLTADGNLTTQAVRATDFPWTRATDGSLTDRDDGFHKRNADGNLTSDGSRNFTWTADEAREREDGAPQARPKGWRDRAPSGRSLQQNRLKKVEPIAPLTTGAKKIEFTYDYLGQRQPKLYDQRAEPIPHRRCQDLDPRRRQQSHQRRRWQSRQRPACCRQAGPQLHLDGWTKRGSAEMAQALLASAGPNGRAPLGRTFGNLVAIYNAASGNALLKTHSWGLDLSGSLRGAGGVGGLLGVKEHSGTHAGTYDFAYDANGNVSEVVKRNTLGVPQRAAHYEYDPFGNTIRSTGTYATANPFRFSTKYFDPETTLYYYGFRYYDPATGRWLSRDPIGERGGLNLYGFVGNDPVNAWDYLGLNELTVIGGGPQVGQRGFFFSVAIETEDECFEYRISSFNMTPAGRIAPNIRRSPVYGGSGDYDSVQMTMQWLEAPRWIAAEGRRTTGVFDPSSFNVVVKTEKNKKGFNFSGWEHHKTYRFRFDLANSSYNGGSIPVDGDLHNRPNPTPDPPLSNDPELPRGV